MLLDDGSVLVEPRATAVSFLITFVDVCTTIHDAYVYSDYVIAQENLSPPTPIAPFLLATLNNSKTILVTILLHLQFTLSDKVPNIEWTEGLAMLIY